MAICSCSRCAVGRNVALTEQLENIVAIERYIGEQEPARTPEAVRVRDEFLSYVSTLSAWDRNFESGAYDRVRNFKLEFNRANAVTPAEKVAVESQALRGLSSEQLRGEPDRRTATGAYIPAASTKDQITKVIIVAAVAVGAVLLLRSKL